MLQIQSLGMGRHLMGKMPSTKAWVGGGGQRTAMSFVLSITFLWVPGIKLGPRSVWRVPLSTEPSLRSLSCFVSHDGQSPTRRNTREAAHKERRAAWEHQWDPTQPCGGSGRPSMGAFPWPHLLGQLRSQTTNATWEPGDPEAAVPQTAQPWQRCTSSKGLEHHSVSLARATDHQGPLSTPQWWIRFDWLKLGSRVLPREPEDEVILKKDIVGVMDVGWHTEQSCTPQLWVEQKPGFKVHRWEPAMLSPENHELSDCLSLLTQIPTHCLDMFWSKM